MCVPVSWQESFSANVTLMEKVIRSVFRRHGLSRLDEDQLPEALAVAWDRYRRKKEQGKPADSWFSAIAWYAAIDVLHFKHLTGNVSPRDALSPMCARLGRTHRIDLDQSEGRHGTNYSSAIPRAVEVKLDFQEWLALLPTKKRRLLRLFGRGYTNREIGSKLRRSRVRIAALRRELANEYCSRIDL